MKQRTPIITIMGLAVILLLTGAASAGQNTFIDNTLLWAGLVHNEYYASEGQFKNIGEELEVNSTYDMGYVEWTFNGEKIKSETGVRDSKLKLDKNLIPKPKKSGDIIQYKAGRDPATKRLRHVVRAKFDGEERTWVILE